MGFASMEEARRYFSDDRFATGNGMTLDEVDAEHSLCSMALTDGCRSPGPHTGRTDAVPAW